MIFIAAVFAMTGVMIIATMQSIGRENAASANTPSAKFAELR